MSNPTSPYRIAARTSEAPSREFVYAPRASRNADGVRTLYWLFAVPMTFASIGGAVASTAGAVSGLLVGCTLALSRWTSRPVAEPTTLTVERGVLTIARQTPRETPRQIVLADLANVILHHREVATVLDGASALPWQRLTDATPGPKLDKAQVVLVDAAGDEVRLAKNDLPTFEATEWLAKVRRYLRSHGWIPEDERPEASGE